MELKHFCTSIANQCVELLIVPYGIETDTQRIFQDLLFYF